MPVWARNLRFTNAETQQAGTPLESAIIDIVFIRDQNIWILYLDNGLRLVGGAKMIRYHEPRVGDVAKGIVFPKFSEKFGNHVWLSKAISVIRPDEN